MYQPVAFGTINVTSFHNIAGSKLVGSSTPASRYAPLPASPVVNPYGSSAVGLEPRVITLIRSI